ncbi:sodium-dependent transporter [Fictibacillus barbaricus]|uniref:Transporter n=1 Tax=Fictibacillus barbaricus TaxID=182136 RepID=A0ABS2ZCZ1_9BACL|nr:sodium-dependent transporter [Fictibacillus barbaricus]MBN3545188.1 sodium-dependent transporter [Fictibacillus barbaricus]GGB60987.1 putative sodium-dependent transporter YocR [Fictibacillus barbaricus]
MKENQQWSSKLGFILAAAGSAIGLGAIWKFPYIAGVSGGGAFFFIFLLFTLLLGLPLLLAEFLIGRSTQKDAIESYKSIAPSSKWHSIGYLGMITCFILLSFYSVIGGWIILYLVKTIRGDLDGLSQQEYGELFGATISDPVLSIGAHLIFMIITIVVVAMGVQKGIERTSKFMMPALFILFLVLIFRSVTLSGAMEGVQFLFYPDFSKLTSETILAALGQSFFTLSVGVSVMVTYSSYLPKDSNLSQSAISIVGMNIMIVVLAGLAIFPAVFSFGLEPNAGPVLLFNVLPTVFNQMTFGMVFFVAFLLLFLFASLTSAFSMLEIIVSVLSKGDTKARTKWSWIIGLIIFAVGVPSALSFGIWSEVSIFNKTIFDAADYLVSNILMPVGALLISIFVPMKMKKSHLYDELTKGNALSKRLFNVWYFLMKYVAPIAIFLVLLDVLGVWKRF